MKISLKYLVGGALIGLILLLSSLISLPDGKLHVVFCDVGQGDAIYLRTAHGEDILVDGGPNDKVLACLGNHMPFYDRTVELVILSHPQADHLNGLISVLERYSVNYFISSGMGSQTQGYQQLVALLASKKVSRKTEASGEKITLDGLVIKTLWPSEEEENILGASTAESAVNELSLVLELSYGQFNALLTGDAGMDIQNRISQIGPIDVLKVPHHGSKTALLSSFLKEIKPQLAVISVGKNSYGHPTQETLNQLSGIGAKILRTDKDGEIEIVSDGKGWYTKAK